MVIASKFPTSEAVLFRVTWADNDGGKMIRWGWRVKIRQAVKNISSPHDAHALSGSRRPVRVETQGGSVPPGQGRRSTDDTACGMSVCGRRLVRAWGVGRAAVWASETMRDRRRSVPAVLFDDGRYPALQEVP